MLAALGLPGPSASAVGRCGGWYRQTRWRWRPLRYVPIRRASCTAYRGPPPSNRDEVTYDRLTRRVSRVEVMRAFADSATWHSRVDSVAAAVATRGGVHIRCATSSHGDNVRLRRHWRFDGFDVRLVAYHFADAQIPAHEWLYQLDAFAPRAPDCGLL